MSPPTAPTIPRKRAIPADRLKALAKIVRLWAEAEAALKKAEATAASPK